MTPMPYDESVIAARGDDQERRSLRLSRNQTIIVVASMLITAVIAVVFSQLSPPRYETRRSMIVYSGANANENDVLSGAFEQIVTSTQMAAEVKRRGGFEESIDQIDAMISTSRSPLSPYIDVWGQRIPIEQLRDRSGKLSVAVGDRLRDRVATVTRDAIHLVTSIGRHGSVDLAAIELAAATGAPIEGTFAKSVKGGLEVEIGGVRAFCPASMAELTYMQDLEPLVGQKVAFKVVEAGNDACA